MHICFLRSFPICGRGKGEELNVKVVLYPLDTGVKSGMLKLAVLVAHEERRGPLDNHNVHSVLTKKAAKIKKGRSHRVQCNLYNLTNLTVKFPDAFEYSHFSKKTVHLYSKLVDILPSSLSRFGLPDYWTAPITVSQRNSFLKKLAICISVEHIFPWKEQGYLKPYLACIPLLPHLTKK